MDFQELEKVANEFYPDNSLKNIDLLRKVVNILDARMEFRNEEQSFEDLFNYAIAEINNERQWDIIKTVVCLEDKWYIDKMRNGRYKVSLHESTKATFDTIGDAVNYVYDKLKSK